MKKKIKQLKAIHNELMSEAKEQDKKASKTKGFAGEMFINAAKHKRAQASGVELAIELLEK